MLSARNPALDGLRGVACLTVLVYHATPWLLPGGWTAVDGFFVLSGYLITRVLLDERERTGRVELGRFYLRRAARLYPALVLAIALAIALGSLGPWSLAVLAVTYLSDIARWQGIDLRGMGHTWSLGIEEHFYLVWPLAVALAPSRRAVALAGAGCAAASLGVMLVIAPPTRLFDVSSFAAPHARVWELLVGAVLATAFTRQLGRRYANVAGVLAAVGAVDLGVGSPFARLHTWQAIAGVALSVAAVVACTEPSWLGRLLSAPPLARIGRFSYGVYLYHYPILVAPAVLRMPALAAFGTRIAAPVLLAAVSFRYVEEPIRRRVRASRWVMAAGPSKPFAELPAPSPG